MTATVQRRDSATTAPPRDLRRFWRIGIALALPIGPLGVTVLRGILPYWTSDSEATIVAKALAHLDTMNAIGWVSMVMMPPLLFGMLMLGYLARRGAPVLATIGSGISFIAYANWGAAGNPDYLVMIMGRNGYSVEAITLLVHQTAAHPIAAVSGVGWVVGHILGMVLLGIALVRAGVLSRWAGALLIASQPVHFISAVVVPSRLLDVTLGWGATTVGIALVSLALLRMTDDEFDLPPHAKTRQRTPSV